MRGARNDQERSLIDSRERRSKLAASDIFGLFPAELFLGAYTSRPPRRARVVRPSRTKRRRNIGDNWSRFLDRPSLLAGGGEGEQPPGIFFWEAKLFRKFPVRPPPRVRRGCWDSALSHRARAWMTTEGPGWGSTSVGIDNLPGPGEMYRSGEPRAAGVAAGDSDGRLSPAGPPRPVLCQYLYRPDARRGRHGFTGGGGGGRLSQARPLRAAESSRTPGGPS